MKHKLAKLIDLKSIITILLTVTLIVLVVGNMPIEDEAIKTQINYGYLPTCKFIEYLLNNVDDFKNIKLNKNINDTCLLDLNIIEAKI